MRQDTSNKFKVLRLSNDLYPDFIGGIAIHVHNLCNDMYKFGFNNTVLVPARKGHGEGKISGYDIIYHKIFCSPFGNCFCPSMFITLMKTRNEYDLIHAHSHLFFSTIIASMVRRIGSPPLIITNHGIMSTSAPDWFNLLYMKTVGKWTLNSADKIISYTEKEKSWLVSNLGINNNKIVVISNGIDTELFSPKESHTCGRNTVLWNGRFVEGKGLKYLLHAVTKLMTLLPDLQVLLVGDGPQKGEIEELIHELNLEKNITIKCFVPYEDMADIYRYSSILVLPSFNEGVPRSMLEAMACGKPVIITELLHLIDIIKNAGLTFQRGNVSELAECIIKILGNDELKSELGKNGRDKVVKMYSWDVTVRKTIDLYDELINNGQVY